MKKIAKTFTLLTLLALLLAACNLVQFQEQATPTSPNSGPSEQLDIEVIETESLLVGDVTASQASSGYFLVVASVMTERLPATQEGDGNDDISQMVLTVNAGNEDGAPVEIRQESIVLIDLESGAVYPPTADVPANPPIVGTSLEAGTSVYGFVGFDVPDDFEKGRLAWCLAESFPCEAPLLADLP